MTPAAAAPSKYVVQVGSKKNQTDALASFADMQQKYPKLLASYRPIVQKAYGMADLEHDAPNRQWERSRLHALQHRGGAGRRTLQKW